MCPFLPTRAARVFLLIPRGSSYSITGVSHIKGFTVLSLFDGIACGRVALERAGIPIARYLASEIDKYAIKVATSNFSDVEEIGDVTKIKGEALPNIDILIGGSPCQGFSTAGKMLNFEDDRSRLFFEFVRILNEVRPRYFLLENVRMRKEWQDIISSHLGVEPIEIDSALVSAQSRKRLYWTNIPGVRVPQDKGVKLVDILENRDYPYPASIQPRGPDGTSKTRPFSRWLIVRPEVFDKSCCLTTVAHNSVMTSLPPGTHKRANEDRSLYRNLTVKECCRLQTLPDDYVEMISDDSARRALGNAWTVDVIVHILSGICINI